MCMQLQITHFLMKQLQDVIVKTMHFSLDSLQLVFVWHYFSY